MRLGALGSAPVADWTTRLGRATFVGVRRRDRFEHERRARGAICARVGALLLALAVPRAGRADDSVVATTSNAAAESAYDAVRTAAERGDDEANERAARSFLARFPRDPLAARVELELGRLFVLRAMRQAGPDLSGVDEAAVGEAETWLARAAAHADAPTQQRTRLYRGVAAYLRRDFDAAIAALEPLRSTLVDPDDRRVEDTALHAACNAAARVGCALDALDALRTACRDETECAGVDESIQELTGRAFDDDDARAWVLEAAPTRYAWRALASRLVARASQNGDWDLVHAIAERARSAHVELDAEGTEIARRVDRGRAPNPRVIGIIAGLTGRSPSVAMACVRAVGEGAGAPPSDRFDPDAFRIIVRDDHGSPADAARAVNDLFWLHRAIAIIGPTDAEAAAAAAARARVLGVPFISLAPVEASRFVTNAAAIDTTPWVRREAIRRFGNRVGVVTTRRTSVGDAPEGEFGHTAGRIDATTRARLAASRLAYLVLESRPSESSRLLGSVRGALRRRASPTLIFDRAAFDRLSSRGPRAVPEGTLVFERVLPANVPRPTGTPSDAAREAFDRIVAAHSATRESLADALSGAAFTEAPTLIGYRVTAGRLVRLSD